MLVRLAIIADARRQLACSLAGVVAAGRFESTSRNRHTHQLATLPPASLPAGRLPHVQRARLSSAPPVDAPPAAPVAAAPAPRWRRRLLIFAASVALGVGVSYQFVKASTIEFGERLSKKHLPEINEDLVALLRECTQQEPSPRFVRLFNATCSDGLRQSHDAAAVYRSLASVPGIRKGTTHVIPKKFIPSLSFASSDDAQWTFGYSAVIVAQDGSLTQALSSWLLVGNECKLDSLAIIEYQGVGAPKEVRLLAVFRSRPASNTEGKE